MPTAQTTRIRRCRVGRQWGQQAGRAGLVAVGAWACARNSHTATRQNRPLIQSGGLAWQLALDPDLAFIITSMQAGLSPTTLVHPTSTSTPPISTTLCGSTTGSRCAWGAYGKALRRMLVSSVPHQQMLRQLASRHHALAGLPFSPCPLACGLLPAIYLTNRS